MPAKKQNKKDDKVIRGYRYAKEKAEQAEEAAKKGYEYMKEKAEQTEEAMVRYIKKNPVKSVLISAFIGGALTLAIEESIRSYRKKSFWEKINPLSLLSR
jgi:ElaB/YqjD/DUF883 family membrane-anchored ribosome-binding protein